MILVSAKFPVKPEHADSWPEITRDFTEKTNAEEGCLPHALDGKAAESELRSLAYRGRS